MSYLSKIEQGKAEPSREIVSQLLHRMGLTWYDPEDDRGVVLTEQAYELLFSGEWHALSLWMAQEDWQLLENSAWGLDAQLIACFAEDQQEPLEEALEVCMDRRQLALQRCLQCRYEEALRLLPCGFLYALAGDHCYRRGDTARAVELLQTAHQLAAQEGRARIMLYARMTTGNCYSNLYDVQAMESHYQAAKRLAEALHAAEELETIAYNTAATQLELGDYEKALRYFEGLQNHTPLTLHKLAICYEKLGRREQAWESIRRAEELEPAQSLPAQAEWKMCRVVRLRLEQKAYLDSEVYGAALLDCFRTCRDCLPSGYAIFHLPWVLEWYEHHRQYKQAYALLRDFPAYGQRI